MALAKKKSQKQNFGPRSSPNYKGGKLVKDTDVDDVIFMRYLVI